MNQKCLYKVYRLEPPQIFTELKIVQTCIWAIAFPSYEHWHKLRKWGLRMRWKMAEDFLLAARTLRDCGDPSLSNRTCPVIEPLFFPNGDSRTLQGPGEATAGCFFLMLGILWTNKECQEGVKIIKNYYSCLYFFLNQGFWHKKTEGNGMVVFTC